MLRRNLIANYLGQGWVALMGILFVPAYIRYLGIEAYGVIGLFVMLQTWLAVLDTGLHVPLRREMARYTGIGGSADEIRDLLRSIEVVALGLAAVVGIGLYLASGWMATHWLQTDAIPPAQVALALSCVGVVIALRLVEGVYRSCMLGLQRQVEFNVANTVTATLRSAGAVGILAWVSPTLEAFFLWQGAVSLVFLLILWRMTESALPRASRRSVFSVQTLRKIGSFAGSTAGVTLLGLMLTQTDKVLLSTLLPLSEYGQYTLAAVVAGGLYVLALPATQAYFPRLSQLHAAGDAAGVARSFHEGSQIVSAILGSAGVVLVTFSEPFLRLWTGDPALAQAVAPILALLVAGTVLNANVGMLYQAQLAHGWGGLGVRVNIVAVLLIVPALVWATPRFGAVGAASVWVALNVGYVLVTPQLMHRRILTGEKARWYLHDVLFPLGAATGVTLLVKLALSATATRGEEMAAIATASVASVCAAVLASTQLRRHAFALLPRAARLPLP